MSWSSARIFLRSKISFELNQLGARISNRFVWQTKERECMSKTDLQVIIWKWTPVDICRDLEIGAYLSGRSESLNWSRAGKLNGISPDDWSLMGSLDYVTKCYINWFIIWLSLWFCMVWENMWVFEEHWPCTYLIFENLSPFDWKLLLAAWRNRCGLTSAPNT